jgi:hypothetical protein
MRMPPRRAALLWTLGILVACSVPGAYVPNVPILSADKLVHIALFGVFGWLWSRAFPGRLWQILLAGAAFGVFIEIWQDTLPIGRVADWFDFVADVIGLVLALSAVAWKEWRRRAA